VLTAHPSVILHGYLNDRDARSVIESADLLLCTSHDEGLCLPLLEAQYGGLPIVAPDEPVFREVLGTSGIFLNSRSPELAADQIVSAIVSPDWRLRNAVAAAANIVRWNDIAQRDRSVVISFLTDLASRTSATSKGLTKTADGPLLLTETLKCPSQKLEIDGQYVNVPSLQDTVQSILARLADPRSFLVCTLNLDHLVKLRRLRSFRQAYSRAEFITADGFPIVWLGRLRGQQFQRVPGSDLIEPLCAAAAQRKLPIFLLGSSLSVLCASGRRLVGSYPELDIVGTYAPPSHFDLGSAFAAEAIKLLQQSGARICFLALGAPLQEAFASRALDETRGIAFIGVGAGLDFLAGAAMRAPDIVQKVNLEWAWRLFGDPRRLWLRYLRCGLLFIELLIRELLPLAKSV
jgi:N-acetylglucosaminyldiphosphoundecaprenol N-acetyl-beta-D-mannosaminyltransferase